MRVVPLWGGWKLYAYSAVVLFLAAVIDLVGPNRHRPFIGIGMMLFAVSGAFFCGYLLRASEASTGQVDHQNN
jgi:hypothetical protein